MCVHSDFKIILGNYTCLAPCVVFWLASALCKGNATCVGAGIECFWSTPGKDNKVLLRELARFSPPPFVQGL